ncbi:hypothetical protein [Novosphingobium clariflavum]|uniref:DUF4132 domain-containing protein n=1 Tax=Novosphingobium clariflavum TaxID=2029884 RepID=A0ABV6S3V6_9SPHN|nr:hypothetical protein [Novosphingobium clariflavum]
MTEELPTPEEILEELAERVAARIGKRAPVAFDGALGEMVRYHRLLIGLHAAIDGTGAAFSYAEVDGLGWRPPFRDWLVQYRRLYERAAELIPDEPRFLEKLAHVPLRLLEPEPGVRLSRAMLEGILDLGPSLVHAIEAWVTRSSLAIAARGSEVKPGELGGSDARALADVMPRVVGAWETLVDRAPHLFRWDRADGDEAGWSTYVAAWPFLRQHLANTAYCLAASVWNGDRTGARLFREALVRWPSSALMNVAHDYHDASWLMFPDLMDGSWAEARNKAQALDSEFLPEGTPGGVFREIVEEARVDVVLITASMLALWGAADGPAAALASTTAGELLAGSGAEDLGERPAGLDFKAAMTAAIRLQMAGERFQTTTYGAWLDRLVSQMDGMRERRVVPGRIFAPSTMNDREELIVGEVAVLAALAGRDSGGTPEIVTKLISGRVEPPDGDVSLRSVLFQLNHYRTVVGEEGGALQKALLGLAPQLDPQTGIQALTSSIDAASAAIEAFRTETLKAKPVDVDAMEALRQRIEDDLLRSPADIPFFAEVEVFAPDGGEGELGEIGFDDVPKARLVRPIMEPPSVNWDDVLSNSVLGEAGRRAVWQFARRPREGLTVDAWLDDPAFWKSLPAMAAPVGEAPTLLVSRDESEGLLRRRHMRDGPLAGLDVVYDRLPRSRGWHIARIEGVDVFATDVAAGTAWLFSGRHLRSIGFLPVDQDRIALGWTPTTDDGLQGRLVATFRQCFEWGDNPILELRCSAEDDAGSADVD